MELLTLKEKIMRLEEKTREIDDKTNGFCSGCIQLQTEIDECFELCENLTDECVDLRRTLVDLAKNGMKMREIIRSNEKRIKKLKRKIRREKRREYQVKLYCRGKERNQ